MSSSKQTESSVAAAHRLVSANPGARLPCPLCGVMVKSENLQRHLEKVHPAYASVQALDIEGPLRLQGRDGKMLVPGAILIGLWAAGTLAATAALQLRPPLPPLPLVVLGGTGLLAFLPVIAAFAGKFPATLELDGDLVRVRWLLGLGTKQVSLPAKLETGALTRQVSSTINKYDQRTRAQQVGTYLRLCGPRALTVGAQNTAGLHKRWAEGSWSEGAPLGSVDIELDREALLLLEYRLAARGQLRPQSS